jgi:hypothetical protein
MATRRSHATNNHLQEAMALLIRNQAAFVEQIARNDQERLKLERESKETFARIEERFSRLEAILRQHTRILEQLPEVIKEKIAFKSAK